jgi:hypothetical protein
MHIAIQVAVDQYNRIMSMKLRVFVGGAFKLCKCGKLGLVLCRSYTTVPRLVSS